MVHQSCYRYSKMSAVAIAARLVCVLLLLLNCAVVCLAGIEHDLSLHLYTKTGEVAQVSYAAAAVQRSSPKVVFQDVALGSITMLSVIKRRSSLCTKRMRSLGVVKDLPLVCISAGYSPDCQYLLNHFSQLVQNHCFLYGESPNAEYIKHHVSRWMTRSMYSEEEDPLSRPLAATVAIIAHDYDTHTNKMVEIHNSGYASETSVSILGGLRAQYRQRIVSLLNADAVVHTTDNAGSKADWVQRCQQCQAILLDAYKGDKEVASSAELDEEEDNAYCVECCVVSPSGVVQQPDGDLPSVQATVEWLKSLL